jgi:hypothetical protein
VPPGTPTTKNQRNNDWHRGTNIFYGKLYSTTYLWVLQRQKIKETTTGAGGLIFFTAKYIPSRTSGYSNNKKYSFIDETTTGAGGLIFFTANYISPRTSEYSNYKNILSSRKQQQVQED